MASISSSRFALDKTSGFGPMVGVGAGIRLFIFTLGPRVRLHNLSTFNLWEFNGELALHIPVKRWDGYFGVHGGYAYVGRLDDNSFANPVAGTRGSDVGIRGGNVGLSVGLDYYLSHFFSLGVDASGEFLLLHRTTADAPPNSNALPAAEQSRLTADDLYRLSGSSAGFAASGSVHAGLHF